MAANFLQPPPQDPRVVLPTALGNPPVLLDLHNALKYKQLVVTSAASNHVNCSTPDDVGRAIAYEHCLAHLIASATIGPAVAPPWFVPVQQQLHRMEATIAKATNAVNGDGSIYDFEIVPFNDGTDPTALPHNLPRISSLADINGLSTGNANRYLVGYGVHPIPGNVAARRRLVKVSIGCRTL